MRRADRAISQSTVSPLFLVPGDARPWVFKPRLGALRRPGTSTSFGNQERNPWPSPSNPIATMEKVLRRRVRGFRCKWHGSGRAGGASER
ncbi:hypothetical protein ES288_A03G071300v1 [Gossypium darwinii]|uniref:Uncharacterized protein n=1 Tax=Gossypium darwinii TaxID=34276 RepID=A0A5D2FRQ7_GOSDA|nr:hypothetical protein ES288_D05G164600v1 [Gossypium darwinii]TYH07239.1 hypothetical protein ES288_A08G217700v1 [Gossypium darwinii]TYH07241.1 hypothetical protein ES288_A08G217900v1 [Gossypium darwinii]TYH24186.1 hypothetical protein ES288_A03G071300v1 [Gossypium darwinii]